MVFVVRSSKLSTHATSHTACKDDEFRRNPRSRSCCFTIIYIPGKCNTRYGPGTLKGLLFTRYSSLPGNDPLVLYFLFINNHLVLITGIPGVPLGIYVCRIVAPKQETPDCSRSIVSKFIATILPLHNFEHSIA